MVSEALIPEGLLTAPEAARLLRVSPSAVRRMVMRGELRAYQVGRRGRLKIHREDVEALVRLRNG